MFENINDIISYIKSEGIQIVNILMCDLTGRIRQLSMPAKNFTKEFQKEGFGFDASNYGFKSVEKSDMVVLPDIKTTFLDPFRTAKTLSMFGEVWSVEDKECRFSDDLRYVARSCEEYVKKESGGTLLLGPEYEFYLFDKVEYDISNYSSSFKVSNNDVYSGINCNNSSSYHMAPPMDRLSDFRDEAILLLEKMGIEIKYHHHEVGRAGQLEIETGFGTILKMADSTVLIKYLIKNLALEYDMVATFMPKPIYGEAGNGHHVHFKLIGEKNNPYLFSDPSSYAGLSKMANNFIAGILSNAKPLAAITNPSTNSYKRLVEGYEAPTAIAYATSNRSAAIRIPGYAKAPSDKRFEYRPSDFTSNPYLLYSALAISGIYGLKNDLNPEKLGFGPFDTNLYNLPKEIRQNIKFLPANLGSAIEALKNNNEFLTESKIISKELIDAWIDNKIKNELTPYKEMVHPIEFQMYFDL